MFLLLAKAARIVSEKIAAGEFQSAAEVVEEAPLAFEERDNWKERERIDALIDDASGSEASEMTAADWEEIRPPRVRFSEAKARVDFVDDISSLIIADCALGSQLALMLLVRSKVSIKVRGQEANGSKSTRLVTFGDLKPKLAGLVRSDIRYPPAVQY